MNGRWPTNVILSHDMAEALDQQSGILKSGSHKAGQPRNAESKSSFVLPGTTTYEDSGSEGGASRFFLTAGYEPWELEWIYQAGLRPCGTE